MKEWLITISAGALAVLAVGGLVAAVMGVPALVAWLLWNHAVAPAFGWPHIGFWLTFAILWLVGIIRNAVSGK